MGAAGRGTRGPSRGWKDGTIWQLPLLSSRIFFIPGNLRHLAVMGEGLRRCGEGKAGEELTGRPGWGVELQTLSI